MANSLQGSIPADLGRCINQLQGEIPAVIGAMGASLKNFVHLNLSGNALSGEIPRSLADLPRIEVLYLGQNRLSGGIQPGLGNLSNLQKIALHGNMLTGDNPSSLGMPRRLSVLSISLSFFFFFAGNRFRGHVPASIANSSGISILQLSSNFFTGIISPEIGRLKDINFIQYRIIFLKQRSPKIGNS
jgi:Leucine-rich repeat (LRR) protein